MRRALRVAALLLLAAQVWPLQEKEGEAKARPLPSNPAPTYPEKARALGVEGDVEFRVDVTETGEAASIEILAAPRLDAGFEEAIREAVGRWRFEPARLNGKPVRGVYESVIPFWLGLPYERSRIYARSSRVVWEGVLETARTLGLRSETIDRKSQLLIAKDDRDCQLQAPLAVARQESLCGSRGMPRPPSWFLAAATLCVVPGPGSSERGSPAMVVFDLVVEDAKGRPVVDLKVDEVDVLQEAERQRVLTFKAQPRPGHYELSYAPASGKVGPVAVKVLRPGARARGPDGPRLKPRFIPAVSPLEAELTHLLETQPDANDFPCFASVLRFEEHPEGVHHTLAVEVPLSVLQPTQGSNGRRLQLLARVKDEDGRVVRRYSLDYPVETASGRQISTQRLVWTGDLPLAPGRYLLETLVFDPATSRKGARTVSFEAPAVTGGFRMSSITLVQPTSALIVRQQGEDDPLFFGDIALLPTVDLVLPVASDASVRFFVVLYPSRGSKAPVSLRLDLVRNGAVVGSAPISLPPPDAAGLIRYVGAVPTKTFRPTPYVLRLVAQQGEATASEEVSFTITAQPQEPSLRVEPR